MVKIVHPHAMCGAVMSQRLEKKMEKEDLRGKSVTLKLKVGVWFWD